MKNIKQYYIFLLSNIIKDKWSNIYNYFKLERQPLILENTKIDAKGNRITKVRSVGPGASASANVFQGASIVRMASESPLKKENLPGTSGVYVTTKDAYTLTDGPTIFISDDIEKIAKFCVQQANIPASIMDDIMKKIEYNKMIGLINNEQKREYETDLRIAFLLKKEEKSIIKKEPRTINKYETGKYINSQSLNYIYN
jgi:hypothetical protein